LIFLKVERQSDEEKEVVTLVLILFDTRADTSESVASRSITSEELTTLPISDWEMPLSTTSLITYGIRSSVMVTSVCISITTPRLL
jgi:hypothetical protein